MIDDGVPFVINSEVYWEAPQGASLPSPAAARRFQDTLEEVHCAGPR